MRINNLVKQEKPFFIASFAFVWQFVFFFIPLAFIFFLSIFKLDQENLSISLTLENFYIFFNFSYLKIILKSLFFASLNSFLCLLVGFPIAYFISFKTTKLKNFFLFLLILPFWTNFLLHIYSWFYVLERSGFLNNMLLYLGIIAKPLQLLNSRWAVILVMLYCYLPFMVLPIYSILERLDRKLVEASYDLGASHWQTFKNIVFSLSMPGVKSGFFLVFVPTFGEFAIPGLVGGEKYMFVGTVISQYILGYKTLSLGAAFTVLSCTALIIFSCILFFLAKKYLKNF